jgi:hypothetical protein
MRSPPLQARARELEGEAVSSRGLAEAGAGAAAAAANNEDVIAVSSSDCAAWKAAGDVMKVAVLDVLPLSEPTATLELRR